MRSFAIIPAAGRSRRMGRPKLLLPWGNVTVIEHVLSVWRASRVDQIVVVLDPCDAALARRVADCGAIVAPCDPPPSEMKDSIRHGLSVVEQQFHPQADDVWLVAPADLPGLSTAVIDRLLAAHLAGQRSTIAPAVIRVPHTGTAGGHPVLFPWSLATQVGRLTADEGLNVLLARHRVEYVEVPKDQAAVEDFDTQADYDQLRARYGK